MFSEGPIGQNAASPATLAREWFYEKNGTRLGPVNEEEMRSLLNKGAISPATLVWEKNFGPNWKKLLATDLYILSPAIPPPLPTTYLTETYARALMLMPLIAYAIEGLVKHISGKSSHLLPFFLSFCTSSVLCFLDTRQIKKSGRNADNVNVGFWFWLIPAYLYYRAKALEQKQRYLFGWTLAFVVMMFLTFPNLLSGGVYWGLGVPSCSSGFATDYIKNSFDNIPQIKLQGRRAIHVSNAQMTEQQKNKNFCTATVLANDGKEYPIVFTVELRDDNIFFLVNLR